MNAKELNEANEAADALIAKLKEIKTLSADLPSLDDLEGLTKEAGVLLETLKQVAEEQAEAAVE